LIPLIFSHCYQLISSCANSPIFINLQHNYSICRLHICSNTVVKQINLHQWTFIILLIQPLTSLRYFSATNRKINHAHPARHETHISWLKTNPISKNNVKVHYAWPHQTINALIMNNSLSSWTILMSCF
jgi:hypothetical protein